MKSESIIELAKALNSFQGKLTAVKKDAVNPFYKSKYATLDTIWETIRKPLSENGLSIAQTMDIENGKNVLVTTLYHTSGEWIAGMQQLNPVKDDPQSLGSAISYARRYSLSALLGVVSDEDDDANTATKPEEGETPKITPAQTKKIYASVKDKGIEVPTIKAYLKDIFHKLSTKELTVSEASKLIEDINAGKLGGDSEGHLVKTAKALGATEIIE